MIYGDPGTIFSLGLYANGSADSFTLSIPSGLILARQVASQVQQPLSYSWSVGGTSDLVSSLVSAVIAPVTLSTIVSAGAVTNILSGRLVLNQNSYIRSQPLGFDFGSSSDPAATETPHRLRFSFRGIAPAGGAILMELYAWNVGRMYLNAHWEGKLEVGLLRGDTFQNFFSTQSRANGVEQLMEVEWNDNPGGPGGTVTFYMDGANAGGPFTTTVKPRIPTGVQMFTNASLDNMRNSVDGLQISELKLGYDGSVTQFSYEPVAGGTIDRATLQTLVVDARSVTAAQPPVTFSYADADGNVVTVDVTVGPLAIPAGQAYKAVLVDWSTGVGVPHPNALVMTRIIAQNCCFQDTGLYPAQTPWIECLPQGPVPNIAGITYYCEAIRIGTYTQFQFGYDWDATQMPNNPFGDPSGKHSYMVPHKWLIYDSTGALLATIETPDHQPLNGADKPALFSGSYDGRGCAIVNGSDKWYPHGTVRSGIIWRSADPAAHDPALVRKNNILYDLSVPFGSHLDFSVNGFDLRIFAGGAGSDGQANGFGNSRVMSWDPTDYATLTARVGVTSDPYKVSLYSANSLAANAAVWLKYTPFNIQGRSPVTGPGGTRDDRQIMPEMVVNYVYNSARGRPHDGKLYRDIALACLTGYVSDPVHCFEQGRNTPLYKGNPRRPIAMRNHYYGPGNSYTPAAQAYYVQGGRLSDWTTNLNPLRVYTPNAGDTPSTPYFGTTQIDKSHGHQFPGWGSLLFKTPEFAFLGHKFWDQNRLYSNVVIGDDYAGLWGTREGAWAFMHLALAWKTASPNSTRLYNRAEVMDFAVYDFEYFYDRHYASTPGFLNPPANLMPSGAFNALYACYAAAPLFGTCVAGQAEITQQDFQIGYWLSALAAGEKMGFNAALRAASAKAAAVLDWLIAMQRKRIVGRILHAPNILPDGGTNYVLILWRQAQIEAVGGDVSRLPRTYEALAAVNGTSASWDVYTYEGQTIPRDGQAMDQLIAGPSLLRYVLNQAGSDINSAQSTAAAWRNAKKADELAKGVNAGEGWFRYLQASNNPAKSTQT